MGLVGQANLFEELVGAFFALARREFFDKIHGQDDVLEQAQAGEKLEKLEKKEEKPEETAKTFVEGWFRSGDLGRIDEEGYYYLTDRLKHIIISGGENISPKEVEAVINRVDGVAESCVVGIPDEKWGEKVAAVIITRPGVDPKRITEKEIMECCREKLAGYKRPKEVIFIAQEEMPRTPTGKILHRVLRERLGALKK